MIRKLGDNGIIGMDNNLKEILISKFISWN